MTTTNDTTSDSDRDDKHLRDAPSGGGCMETAEYLASLRRANR